MADDPVPASYVTHMLLHMTGRNATVVTAKAPRKNEIARGRETKVGEDAFKLYLQIQVLKFAVSVSIDDSLYTFL